MSMFNPQWATSSPGQTESTLTQDLASPDVVVLEQRQHGDEDQRGWGTLDKGLLPIIASRLQRNLGPLRLVCRQWAAELPQGCSSLRVKGTGPSGWEHRFCGLEELMWQNPPDNVGHTWPKLKSLRLAYCQDEDLQLLRNMPGLASLGLIHGWGITDGKLKELVNLSALTSLDLSFSGITDEKLQELENLSTLKSLRLKNIWNGVYEDYMPISDVGLKGLRHMSGLTSLNLDICYQITDDGLKDLLHMSALTSLNLTDCDKITDVGLKELVHFSALTSLNLHWCDEMTDDGLKDLRYLSDLTSLTLGRCKNITDDGLKSLRYMSALTSLNVADCDKITDVGLKELVHFSALTSLDLHSCKEITDAGLKDLGNMCNLAFLNLADCDKITDTGLKELGSLSALTSLDISLCDKITDAGLRELKRLSNLTSLNLRCVRNITDAGRKELTEELPNLSCQETWPEEYNLPDQWGLPTLE